MKVIITTLLLISQLILVGQHHEIGITQEDYDFLINHLENDSVISIVKEEFRNGENLSIIDCGSRCGLQRLFSLNNYRLNDFLISKNFYERTLMFFTNNSEYVHYSILYMLFEKLSYFEEIQRKPYCDIAFSNQRKVGYSDPPLIRERMPNVIMYNEDLYWIISKFLDIEIDYSVFNNDWMFSDDLIVRIKELFKIKITKNVKQGIPSIEERAFLLYLENR